MLRPFSGNSTYVSTFTRK